MGLIAIIGGTGVCDPKILSNVREGYLDTYYGSIRYWKGTYNDRDLIFLARHGRMHSIPPHLINYRANILGLKRLGVTAILATTAVGSMNPEYKPGDFVLPDQFIDFTKSRHTSFFDGGTNGVVHVDMTEPYCPTLRRNVIQAAAELGDCRLHDKGTYVCTEGPRFETPAEIRMFQKLGGDIVGMTNVPEVCLAREAEICYATVSMVTNFAAGISDKPLTHEEVVDAMAKSSLRLRQLILKSIEIIPSMKTAPAITRSRLTEGLRYNGNFALGKRDPLSPRPDGPALYRELPCLHDLAGCP